MKRGEGETEYPSSEVKLRGKKTKPERRGFPPVDLTNPRKKTSVKKETEEGGTNAVGFGVRKNESRKSKKRREGDNMQ